MSLQKRFQKEVLMAIHQLNYNESAHKECGFGHLIDNDSNNNKEDLVFLNEFDVRDDTQQDCINIYNLRTKEIGTINGWWHHYDNFHGYPITIGRVMKALNMVATKAENYMLRDDGNIYSIDSLGNLKLITTWKLTNKDGSDCTDKGQPIGVINKLLNILIK